MEMLCMTDHAPALPDAPHIWHFRTMCRLPREIDGVKLMFGAEANVIDKRGGIDLPVSELKNMDMAVASIHSPCYAPGTVEEHTATWLGVIKNPYVTILGHSGSPRYAYDIDTVVKAAKEYNKCIEINNHSYDVRSESVENCRKIALACKRIGTRIVVSSDAHCAFEVGVFDSALKMLEEIDFPEELVMNTSAKKFEEYVKGLKEKRN